MARLLPNSINPAIFLLASGRKYSDGESRIRIETSSNWNLEGYCQTQQQVYISNAPWQCKSLVEAFLLQISTPIKIT